MEIKQTKIVCGIQYQSERGISNLKYPSDLKWVRVDGPVSNYGLHDGCTNYWTIVDNILVVELLKQSFRIQVVKYKENIWFIQLYDIEPNENLETVDRKVLLTKFNIYNDVILAFNKDYQLCKLIHINNVIVPCDIDVHIIQLKSSECWNQDKKSVEIYSDDYFDLNRFDNDVLLEYYVPKKDVGQYLYEEAQKYVISIINNKEEYSPIKWRHNIKSDVVINKLNPIDDIMNILNIETQVLRVSEMNEYLSQFDCNLDKINRYRN